MAGQVGFSLGNAIHMATRNPARFTRSVSALNLRAPADIVRFYWCPPDSRLRIDGALLGGVCVA